MSTEKPERSLLALILIPAIISNVVTLLRLGVELAGLSDTAHFTDAGWWVSVSLLIPVFGLYFAYMLQDARRPFAKLPLTLLVYGLTVRIPTAFLYWFAGNQGWHTHYSDWTMHAGGSYLKEGFIPQMFIWPIITVVAGCIAGYPLLLWLRSRKTSTSASAV